MNVDENYYDADEHVDQAQERVGPGWGYMAMIYPACLLYLGFCEASDCIYRFGK